MFVCFVLRLCLLCFVRVCFWSVFWPFLLLFPCYVLFWFSIGLFVFVLCCVFVGVVLFAACVFVCLFDLLVLRFPLFVFVICCCV